MGKILRVDLSSGEVREDFPPTDVLRRYLGGRGLGLHLLQQQAAAGDDPFAPETPLIFMTGPYTGTGVFSAFYNVTTVSPLTGLVASAHSGGTWGPKLKKAGFDGLIITGRAAQPTYLLLEDGSARLCDATGLWGLGVRDTQSKLQELHPRSSVAAIGPSGEKRVRFAAIMNDIHRAAGRGGVGAVMGAKNLKAVVAGGSQKVDYFDREASAAISREAGKAAREVGATFAKYGTSVALGIFNAAGALPVRNFTAGHFDQADQINGEALKTQYWLKDMGCYNCPLRCSNLHGVPNGPYAVEETEGPEYETLMSFGSNCGNADLASIIKANDLCNDLGMDTISAGNTIAFAIDAAQRGYLSPELTAGLELRWGHPPVILQLLEMMAQRSGLGDLLAEGSLRAGRELGPEVARLAIHTKGQEFPGYEVRRAQGTGLSFATSSRGADHLRACMYVDELIKGDLPATGFAPPKIEVLVAKENLMALTDCVVMCKFGQRNGGYEPDRMAETMYALTGFDYNGEEMLKVGERVYNLERVVNFPALPEPDVLPPRVMEDSLQDDLQGGGPVDPGQFAEALQAYYQQRGWDSSGLPGKEKQSQLEI